LSIYNLAIFASSFPYPNIEVDAIVMGIVVVGIVAYGGGNSRLRGGIGRNISKVIVGVLLGID
jgi:hypothetical protein